MSRHPSSEEEEKPCRACSDFKSWAKKQSKATLAPPAKQTPPPDCPLDKEELGRSTWGFLHSMVAYYPQNPRRHQRNAMCSFFTSFAMFYPCVPCAKDFEDDIKQNPPRVKTREELEQWLCERHNTVNLKLGKPVFDCSKVAERWRDGWKDGSCD